jgi:hypothetical protein
MFIMTLAFRKEVGKRSTFKKNGAGRIAGDRSAHAKNRHVETATAVRKPNGG